MKHRPIVVRHPSLDTDEDIDEFGRLLAEGLERWVRSQALDLQTTAQQLRRTLLKRIMLKATSLITPKVVAKIHGAASAQEGRELAKLIRDELSRFVYSELVTFSGLPRRGRKREFATRDQDIYKKRQRGASYGQIAREIKISRHGTQAAYRRERKRRDLLRQGYDRLKQSLEAVGIILKEEKTAS